LNEEIQKTEIDIQSEKGPSWKVPHFVGKKRMDQDRTLTGETIVVNVIDVVFHTNI